MTAPEALRCALILRWAETHAVDLDRLPPDSTATRFVSPELRRAAEAPLRRLRARDVRPSLKDVEGAFERSRDAAQRRGRGATYTPDAVIDHLLHAGLALLSPGSRSAPVVCDPACGTGGFLLRAARLPGAGPAAIYERLVGFDSDPAALDGARCLLSLFILGSGEVPREERFRLHLRDTLLDDADALRSLSPAGRGFDLVATNPPYVRVQSLDHGYRERLVARHAGLITGSYSLAPLFLVAGHRLLADGGVMAVITQNNLYTSLSGLPVRSFLQQRGALRRVIDLGHRRVFERASAYTCLVFLGREAATHFDYGELAPAAPLDALPAVPTTRIELASLEPRRWRLASSRHAANLRRIETAGAPLGAVAEIRVGFATLRDSVFLLRRSEGRWADPGAAGVELAATRAVVKVSGLRTEADLPPDNLRALFPYRKSDGRYRLLDESVFREEFPGAYAYMRDRRASLDARDKGRRDYGAWFAWGRTQGLDAPGPKLLTKAFSRGPCFLLDGSDRPFCNGYSVSLPATSALDLRLLQRVLNSAVMDYYARLTSFQIEGDYQCYQKNFIERFGVPAINAATAAALSGLSPAELDAALCELYGVSPRDVHEVVGGT